MPYSHPHITYDPLGCRILEQCGQCLHGVQVRVRLQEVVATAVATVGWGWDGGVGGGHWFIVLLTPETKVCIGTEGMAYLM